MPQRAKDTVNDLPQMAKNNVSLFACVSLSDVIAGVDILDKKNEATAHAFDFTSNNSWIFFTIIKDSVLPR